MITPEALPVPDGFKCPITQDLMFDPVSTVDGHTYEKDAIVRWLRQRSIL